MPSDSPSRADTIAASEVRAALERVAASNGLSRSGQLQRLLRFLVDETLAGRAERLKEYVIGVEVFGRPASYDPRLDSLVRVEARRLRGALEAYYADEGRADPIVIELHKGAYVPSFRRSTPVEHAGTDGTVAATPATGRRTPTVVTFVLIVAVVAAIAAAAALLFRSKGATALTDRDSILLAGFSNTTGEPIFDDTLKQGLTMELEQSPFLNIVSDRRAAEILKLMARPSLAHPAGETARELCVRAAATAMVEGSIARLGAQYVIGLTATNCATGDAFAHVQVEAARKEAVLRGLSDAASRLRDKLGESLASIRSFDAPLDEATTPSLEALQSYSVGRRTAREQGSPADIPYYKRAIDIDPNFAAAHAALGVSYVNLGQPSVAAEYLAKAHQMLDRVSEHEKYRISAYYYHVVTGELEKANEVYGLWKQNYPRDFAPYINVGISYTWLGEYGKSAAETSQAMRLEPGNVLPYSNLAANYIKLDRPEEARATLQRALERKLSSKFVRSNLCYLAFLSGDEATIERQLEEVRNKPGDEDPLLSQQSDTEAYYGRLERARDYSRRAVQSATRAGAREAAAGWLVNGALREAEFGNAAEARRAVTDSLHLSSGRDVVALAALASARAGDTAGAARLLRDLEQGYPLNTVIRAYWAPTIRAAIALAEGQPDRAIGALETTLPYELGSPPPMGLATLYPVYLRGEAYLRLRNGGAAAAEFQKMLDHPGLLLNFPLRPLAQLQVGRARALSADMAGTRAAYESFFGVWKNADPGIRLLKQARAEFEKLEKGK